MFASRRALSMLLSAIAAFAAIQVATSAAAPSAETAALLEAIEKAATEEDAMKIMEAPLADLKKLDNAVMEKVVLRQWWNLARDIVAKSHEQKIDLSFSVRKAVRTLKDEADELLRTLNPKYGQAQQVTPAFQWAQNDTCIFLTVKWTVRWNAPGALEVFDPSVNMSANSFNFTGFGKHSNNKYKYSLGLGLFDNILPDFSTWSAASVGKMSVTLRKKWARKWPRLLGDKKLKIGNMHVWMEQQDKLEGTLGGMTSVSNSPITCAMNEKLYCLATDTCKKAANCTQCPGKDIPKIEDGVCAGVPTEKGSVSFKDADMDRNELGGEITIHKARNEFDIDTYVVYFGKDDKNKLEKDGVPIEIGKAKPISGDVDIKMPMNTPVPEGATHFLVYSRNEYGEYAVAGFTIITDAVLPKEKPRSIAFEDEDGDRGYISGSCKIQGAMDQDEIDDYSLHWAKTATKKIATGSLVRNVPKDKTGNLLSHYFSKNTRIPDGATHLIAYSKNSHGEHPDGVSIKISDKSKPCVNKTDADCPQGVEVAKSDGQIKFSVKGAAQEAGIESYALYWGRRDCNDGGQSGAKNGHIQDLKISGASDAKETSLPAETVVPAGTTHVLVFSKSRLGESNHCAAISFESDEKGKPEL